MDALTIDQLLVFTTTVDEGSFSSAARTLNRAQSAITYAMQKLEDQVGTPLFDRSAYRPTLTPAGRALLPRARRILTDVHQFRSQAKGLVQGLEPEVRIGLSEIIPVAWLAPALSAFRATYPTVSVRIIRGAFGLGDGLLRGDLHLAVLPDVALPDGLDSNHLSTVDLIAVAASSHPLAAVEGPVTTDMLREELQIVLTDPREGEGARDWGVAALDSWRVTDLATKHDLLLRGIGWGSMPAPLVAQDIAEGRLAVLPIERWDGSNKLPRLSIVAACQQECALGPAGAALLQMIMESAVHCT